jgi:hypothetical protein
MSLKERYNCILLGGVDKVYGRLGLDLFFNSSFNLSRHGYALDASSMRSEWMTELADELNKRHRALPVFVDKAISTGHYEGFCKQGKAFLFTLS